MLFLGPATPQISISHGLNLRWKYISFLFRKVMPINVTKVITKTNKFTPRLTGDFACILF